MDISAEKAFDVQHHATIVLRAVERAGRMGTEGSAVSVEMIAAIFERVLQFSPIAADSDFFELGGDSITAIALAVEVETALGVTLPVATLFDAPTPATLARAIAKLSAARLGPMVLLKPGSERPPVFLVPGLGGSPIAIGSFARRIDIASPIYGFQAPGLDGSERPLSRIEDIAAHFLPAIRMVQPHGPYFLGGHSMGGLTALHLAQMLVAIGEPVALLAMFDTYINPKRLAWHRKLGIWRRRTALHVAILRRKHWHEAFSYALGRVPGLLCDLGVLTGPLPGAPRRNAPMLSAAKRRVLECGLAAAAAYRPAFYPGTITFFRAKNDAGMETYPDLTWRGLSRGLEIHEVDGDHWNILLTRGTDAAQQFARSVRSALALKASAGPAARPDRLQR